MKNLPFDIVNLGAGEVQALEDAYKALKAKFNIGLPDTGAHINKFELFNNEKDASLSGTVLIDYPATDHYLNFVKIHYLFTAGRTNLDYFKYQVWAFVTLNRDFGRVLIRRETFTDMILDLIHHTTLTFKDDKTFNENFYVVANDPEKANAAMTTDFRKVIADMMYKDFVIEIINKTLVIRNNQPVNTEDTIHLAEFASKLSTIK